MLKLTGTVLAVVLASSASAAGWRSLVIDGGSEAAFAESLAAFQKKLPPARRTVFKQALEDIWLKGTRDAEANQREYTAADYYRQVDGLGYEGITRLTDPTGETEKMRYRAAYASVRNSVAFRASPWPSQPAQIGFQGQQVRGGDSYRNPYN